MGTIEDIGPILGVVAFLGFAALSLLIVLQAREVRRLREWAGRAPERAVEADEAAEAVAEARGEAPEPEPRAIAVWWGKSKEKWGHRYAELDRRSPVDPRWFAVLVAALIAAGVLTGGFGLTGGEETDPEAGKTPAQAAEKVEVAVLNASGFDEGAGIPVEPVPGLAAVASDLIVKPTDFKVGVEDEAPEGQRRSVVMYEPEFSDEAAELATAARDQLGDVAAVEMTESIREVAKGAGLALLVGLDNSDLGADDALVP